MRREQLFAHGRNKRGKHMTPSQVLNAYRVASRHARAIGQTFAISRTRLQGFGWTEEKIDALFKAIERIDDMEDEFRVLTASLDARFAPKSKRPVSQGETDRG